MIHDVMNGDTMWGMGVYSLLALIITVLVIATLVKYLFFN